MEVSTEPTELASSGQPSRPSGIALVASLVVLVAFAGFVLFLAGQAETNDVRWSRLAWLFSSVEAIAFGAAGALFGSSIQRQRAERAEEEASKNRDKAAAGEALAAHAKVEEELLETGDAVRGLEALGGQPDDAAALAAIRRQAALARRFFPG